MLDAADLAAILDSSKLRSPWWEWDRKGDYSIDESSVRYIGPPDLHTAREHCWRKEDWLIERGCRIYRNRNNDGLTEVLRDDEGWLCYPDNHAAALNAAIERIVNNG